MIRTPDANGQITVFGFTIDANEYGLPDDMTGWNVVDMGSHHGTFADACLRRNAASVLCYEACLENYVQSVKNLAKWGEKVNVNHCAVWKSGEHEPVIFSNYSLDVENNATTEVGIVCQGEGLLKTIGLDAIIADFAHDKKTLSLLKVDIEAAEFAVLYSSRLIGQCERIVMECHDITKMLGVREVVYDGYSSKICSKEAMSSFLSLLGFDVSTIKEPASIWNYLSILSATKRKLCWIDTRGK